MVKAANQKVAGLSPTIAKGDLDQHTHNRERLSKSAASAVYNYADYASYGPA